VQAQLGGHVGSAALQQKCVMKERLGACSLGSACVPLCLSVRDDDHGKGWMEGTVEADDDDDDDDDNNDDDNMYFDVPCVSHKIAILGQPHRGANPLCRPQLAKQASRDVALHPRPRISCA